MDRRLANIQAKYERVRERFTWRRHVTDNGLTALSPVENQFHEWCMYFSTAVTMESIFRLLEGRDIFFSVQHLKELSDEAKQQYPNMTAAKRLLKKLAYAGVLSETDYQGRPQYGLRYCVSGLRSYDLDNIHHIRAALYELRRVGPLLAVIRISKNYDKCWNTGEVYKYDPKNVCGDSARAPTHAISVISFALENGPFFDCQDSHGVTFGSGGFLKVDVTSFKELYSFRVVEVFGDWTD
ncbi:uncharacterized protein LOC119341506 [Triticum dicoccoides]|uniref:Uncharacterized protein n=1 Tax=Triticum turgidum subsp. durum TaxID=4567 RepID=A0A9R1AG12_TRITD|nr:uncharacterized protein LOC119341506 [Triticum dicoccoides]VAI94363.1 unnamed protein product [Triticum turgidum subsp. durum]